MTKSKDSERDVPRAVCAQRIADRGVDEMIGICRGMIADGRVEQSEAEYILRWLEAPRRLRHPGSMLLPSSRNQPARGLLQDPREPTTGAAAS